MAGHRILIPGIGVRVPVPQPIFIMEKRHVRQKQYQAQNC